MYEMKDTSNRVILDFHKMFNLILLTAFVAVGFSLPVNYTSGSGTLLEHPASVNKDVMISSKAADAIMSSNVLDMEKMSLNVGRKNHAESIMSQCNNSDDRDKCKTLHAAEGFPKRNNDVPEAKSQSERSVRVRTEVGLHDTHEKLMKLEQGKNATPKAQESASETSSEKSSLAQGANAGMSAKPKLDSSAVLKSASTTKSHYTFIHPIPVSELFNRRNKPKSRRDVKPSNTLNSNFNIQIK